jgi:hypothetical protein
LARQNSASLEVKQNDETNVLHELVTHPSPEKFLSPEKTGFKYSGDVDENTVSKLYLEEPADIEAKGVEQEYGKITEDEQEHASPIIDKDLRKETIK